MYVPAIKSGLSRKLSSLWRGPCTVLDKVTNVNYKIQLIGSTKCQIVHANRLKLYYGHPEPELQQISRNERNAGHRHSHSNQPDDASGHLILEEEDEEEAPVHGEEDAMIQDDVIREDEEAPVHGEEDAMIQDDVTIEDGEVPVHVEEEATQEDAPRNENERGEDFGPDKEQMEVPVRRYPQRIRNPPIQVFKRHSSCVDTRN